MNHRIFFLIVFSFHFLFGSFFLWAEDKKGFLFGKVSIDNPAENSAVVYVTGFEEAPPPQTLSLQQLNKKFSPLLLPMTQGQAIEIINKDQVKHNVFSVSPSRNFDLGLTSSQEQHKLVFSKPGIVDIYCNIHPEMVSTVLVLPNRAYALTDKEGHYKINHIPVGKFTVYAWHPLAQPEHRQVTIQEGGGTQMDWTLKISKKQSPHLNKFGRPYTDRKQY